MFFKGIDSLNVYNNSLIWHGNNYELLDFEYEIKKKAKLVSNNIKSLWRYKDFLPFIDDENIVSVSEGFTPLLELNLGSKPCYIKMDQIFLSGSYKDRGASVLISFVKQLGIKNVVQDSSGNAGASIAVYCALAKISCDIYVPKETSSGKVVQAKASGAKVILVEGDREKTAEVAFDAAKKSYYASHCYNPVFFEGTKTFLFEVFEQLNFKMPEAIVLPAGNGTLLLGCFLGAKQLINAGIADNMPKLIAVQSSNCNPLYKFINNEPFTDNFGSTIAEGIAIKKPVRLKQMAEAVKQSNGLVINVDDEDIKKTWFNLAKMGFMVEPTSAATITGLNIYLQNYVTSGNVVSLFSGNGLKSTDKWINYLN
ncbi:MAG: threonine synthase [Bacteroidia bacterium]